MKAGCAFLFIFMAFASFSQNQDVTKIALIGCHKQHEPAPALTYFFEKLDPDYAVWLGDNVYADTKTNPDYIREQLHVLEAKDGFRELRESVPFFVTWDDHDYGLNNSGAEYEHREESKQIFREFWQLEDEIPADRDGVYYSVNEELPNGKTIQFLMVDGRYNNTRYLPNIAPEEADILGEKQWQWLENELKKPADIRFFITGQQVLLDTNNRWEAWSKVGRTQQRLDDLLVKLNVNDLIFLTGDQHTAEVLESLPGMRYYTMEIMACGINQTETPDKAANRLAGPDLTLHSAPLLEIFWEKEKTYITITNYDVENDTKGMQYSFFLDRIRIR